MLLNKLNRTLLPKINKALLAKISMSPLPNLIRLLLTILNKSLLTKLNRSQKKMKVTCELMERLLRLLRLPLLWLDRSLKAPLFPFWPPKVGAPLLSLEYYIT